jgi:hypothetical protein
MSGRMPFRSAVPWLWIIGTAIMLVGIGVWGVITQPAPGRWLGAAFVIGLLAFGTWVIVRGPGYLDGTVLVQHGLLRTHRAELVSAVKVRLRPNWGGSAQLAVTDAGGKRAFVPLLTITDYVTVAQPPEVLDHLAAALTSAKDSNAAAVRKALRLQADHLRRGGSPKDSPLRPLTSQAMLRMAQAGGTASFLGLLD